MWRYLCVFALAAFVMVVNGVTNTTSSTYSSVVTTMDASISPKSTLISSESDDKNISTTVNIPSTSVVITPDKNTTSSDLTTTSIAALTTTTTSAPTTTTSAPTTAATNTTTTTEAPPAGNPPLGNWTLNSDGHPCIDVKMAVQFKVDYSDVSGNKQRNFNLPENATVNKEKSSCGFNSSIPILFLEFGSNYFELVFQKTKDIYVKKLNVSLILPTGANLTASIDNLTLFEVDYDTTYKCSILQTQKLDENVTVTFEKVQLQVYNTNSSTFTKEYLCDSDRTSDSVPIAVGCALAGLVIIVLIAYLVGRRRSRQKGYQSV